VCNKCWDCVYNYEYYNDHSLSNQFAEGKSDYAYQECDHCSGTCSNLKKNMPMANVILTSEDGIILAMITRAASSAICAPSVIIVQKRRIGTRISAMPWTAVTITALPVTTLRVAAFQSVLSIQADLCLLLFFECNIFIPDHYHLHVCSSPSSSLLHILPPTHVCYCKYCNADFAAKMCIAIKDECCSNSYG
jgi:hypothetical protein